MGDILSIDMEKVYVSCFASYNSTCILVLFFNKLNSITLSAALSHSRGIHTELMDNIFVVIMAVVVMLCIKWFGILIINAMLILPAAAARTISSNIREYTLFSLIFAVYLGISGLIISYYASVATGPMIVVISAVIYFITLLAKRAVCKVN